MGTAQANGVFTTLAGKHQQGEPAHGVETEASAFMLFSSAGGRATPGYGEGVCMWLGIVQHFLR